MIKICFFIILFSTNFTNFSYAKNFYIFGSIGISDTNISKNDKAEINSKLQKLGFSSVSTSTKTKNLTNKFGFGIKFH